MKTLSEHPLLIGRVLARRKRHLERRQARAAARERFWRSPRTTIWLGGILLGLVWVLLRQMKWLP